MTTIKVPSVPVAQPRQRHAIINGQVRNYTPTKDPVNAYKAAIQLAVENESPVDGPVHLQLEFVLPRPKSKVWKTKPMPRYLHSLHRPDVDNLAKSTMDALKGIMWRDDGQVARLDIVKMVAAGDEAPHVVITCNSIPSEEDA